MDGVPALAEPGLGTAEPAPAVNLLMAGVRGAKAGLADCAGVEGATVIDHRAEAGDGAAGLDEDGAGAGRDEEVGREWGVVGMIWVEPDA